jgi:STE24 endopeptidase
VNEDRSARYHKLGRRAAVVSTAWSACLLALLAVTPASVWLRCAIEGLLAPFSPPRLLPSLVVLGYVTVLGIVHECGELPIAFFSGFVLEHRYGLSTESARHWANDHVKGLALGAALSLAGFSLLYVVIRHWPAAWWLIAAAGFTGVVVLLTRLGPVILMPIFFTFRPLSRDPLRERLLALSRKAGVPVTDAVEWVIADRTKKANAALAGLGRTRRILISDTLLAGYSDDEIEVILAHELAHQIHHDVWRGIAVQATVVTAGFFVASLVMAFLSPRLGWQGVADVAGLPVLLLTAGLLSLVLLPAVNAASRRMERAADRFALELTGHAGAFQTAMQRLASQNLSEERPSRLALWLFYTHPPVPERVAAARAWAERRHTPVPGLSSSR